MHAAVSGRVQRLPGLRGDLRVDVDGGDLAGLADEVGEQRGDGASPIATATA
ncbi:MAG: hypothetical protein ACRDYX_19100 [Egibacteraceae bacterium]